MGSRFAGLKFVCAVSICVVAVLFCISSALAQSATTGALSGTVTDPSGGVVSAVTVTATNLGTGQSRTTATDSNGSYTFSLLPPGNYKVTFAASGFTTAEVPSVTIDVTATEVLNRTLTVGSQSQQVTVEANAVTLQTQNATVGSLVSGNTVTSLPLSTRNFTQVIDLSPGVVANVSTATAVGNGTQDINVNGSGSDQNTYLMDGVIVTNYGSGGAAQSGSYAGIPIPNPDSIQEFKVQTSQYDAAYGQNPGANVNVVTKSGTNVFHGSVWEFNRNNIFNANDFFYKYSELKSDLPNKPPTVKQNQYGGTIGGPIKKDKIFFFGSYQATRQLNGIGSNGFATAITSVSLLPFNEPGVPFSKARSDGNVGSIPQGYISTNPMCNYATYRQYLGCAFANQFDLFGGTGVAVAPDGSNISNTAINLLRQTEKIPQAQGGYNNGYYIPSLLYNSSGLPFCDVASGACGAPTTISQPTIANEDQFMINTDYVLSPKNTLTQKYFFSKDPQTQSFSCIVTGCYPGAPEDAHYGSQSLVVRLTSVLSSNVVNEVYGSFQRLYLNVADGVTVQSCAGDGTTPLNITPAVNDGTPCPLSSAAAANREDSLVPVIGVLGFPGSPWGGWSSGGNFFSATKSIQNSFLTGDQLSWNHGKHSFRFGIGTQRIQWNWAQPNRERGWIIAGNTADILTASSGPAVDGTPFTPINYVINSTWRLLPNGSPNPHNWRINEFSSYAQDDYKVTRKLTVNLGVRWEYDGWPTDKNGVFTNFAASAAGLVDTGSFFLNNPGGTLAGYIVQKNYNRSIYGNLTGQFGSTGILINSNKTLLQSAPLDNFSPRIGLAWQAMDKLVVRAGYGMFFDRVYGNLVGDNILGNMPPYATGVGINPGQTLQNPFCTPSTCPQFLGFIPRTLAVAAGGAATGATNITDVFGGNASGLLNSGDNPSMRTPKIQQYNLDVQYEFAHGWVADIGYVGTHGIHLYDWNRDPNLAYLVDCGAASATCNPPTDTVNQLLEHPASSFPMNDAGNTNPATQVLYNTATNYLGRVAYLGVNPGNLQQVTTDGNSLYDSLQVMIRHNFANGLLIQAAYTWSNLKTDINASQAGSGIATPGNVLSGSASSNDPLNYRQQYGPAAFNRPQRFVLTYRYDLPYKGEGWHEKLLGGWGVSGVTTIQDGLPFSITDSVNGNQATLLYGSSVPPTGPYSRVELAHPVDCNSLGNCKSSVPLGSSGSMYQRVVSGLTGGAGYFNPAAFAPAPLFGGAPSQAAGPYTGACTGANPQFVGCGTGFGNSGVGIMRCCTQLNFDMAIVKNTVVGGINENAALEFRAEFFNLFNHAQFNQPGNGFGSATFGQITSSSVPGRIMQFGLKYTF
ncbi:MAG TPA: carboxypeptidase regulatory-like domain-containing protein [Candidatus Dormibacteraeota bacterium]|nr:carboxypeptidase regulatory-like domain-containing protein [Candidatus Dormibacteraeota bacterium]